MIGYVYGIICPELKEVVYVGATTRSVGERIHEHFTTNAYTIIGSYLKRFELKPEFVIIEKVSFYKKESLLKREAYWIRVFSKNGILNTWNNPKSRFGREKLKIV
jgi:hypothetical protein